MTGSLITKKDNAYGIITSGGSESLIMALYAYKKYYKNRKYPNVYINWFTYRVMPVSGHAAVDKGCFYFNI